MPINRPTKGFKPRKTGVIAGDKQCPECAETIKAVAKICRHCGWRSVTLRRPNRCDCGGIYTEEPPAWSQMLFGYLGCRLLGFAKKRCAICGKSASR